MMTKRRSYWLVAAIVVVLAVVAFRLALPSLVKNYLNEQLAMEDYRGHVADVDIALWRGAYSLGGVEVVKVDSAVPVPLFEADSIDLSVSWRALFRGAVVAEVDFINAELHFVDGGKEDSQFGTGTDWREGLTQLVPIRIDRLEFRNGDFHFHNFQTDPEVHLVLTEINGSFDNITNADRSEGAVYAGFNFDARMLDSAHASVDGRLDPFGDFQDFSINLKITDIDLTQLNELAEAYGNFEFEEGEGEFVMELDAENGALTGYAKPVLDNVAILDLEKSMEKGLLNAAWETVVAAFSQIFRNQPKDRIAAQIEIRGELDHQEVSAWQAFTSIVRNAFVEAYQAEFELQ